MFRLMFPTVFLKTPKAQKKSKKGWKFCSVSFVVVVVVVVVVSFKFSLFRLEQMRTPC